MVDQSPLNLKSRPQGLGHGSTGHNTKRSSSHSGRGIVRRSNRTGRYRKDLRESSEDRVETGYGPQTGTRPGGRDHRGKNHCPRFRRSNIPTTSRAPSFVPHDSSLDVLGLILREGGRVDSSKPEGSFD